MNYKTRTNQNSRPGVTLLFTISMIVLFLLMGTTFVVVANDYYKTAVRRSRLNTFKVDTVSLMDRAFLEAFRGPSMNDTSSPLRGLDLLTDVYGFGFRGTLVGGPGSTATLGPNLVALNVNDVVTETLRNPDLSLPLPTLTGDPNYVDGLLNGRVITFTSGEAAGYSTRIVSQAFVDTDADGAPDQLQFVILRDKSGIDWTNVGVSDEYIVNGREYSGYGGGVLTGTYDPDAPAAGRLAPNSLYPIQIGVPREQLTQAPDLSNPSIIPGYLPSAQSPNEAHDAPDVYNFHLAGVDGAGNPIPSFHRDRLYSDQSPGIDTSLARQLTMRPFYIDSDGDGEPDPGSTANSDFENNFVNGTTGALANTTVNATDSLDVDNDSNGTKDSVWINIGLPIQTDDQGRRFRPLVAYHIIDLDGRLNLNAHGSQADAAIGSPDLHGIGVGPADISLSLVAGSDYANLLDERYGVSENLPGSTDNSLTQGQKLFGHPIAPNYLGGLFGSALPFLSEGALVRPTGSSPDSFPSTVLNTMAPSDAEHTTSPYASDFSLGGGTGDSHFEAAELESIYRGDDIDGNLMGGRLHDDFSIVRGNASKVTTDSFDIAIPATTESVIELLRARVLTSVGAADLREVMREFLLGELDPANKYISPEMILGGRFNLNRPLGNGIDDDGDGVVDDAEEVGSVAQSTAGFGDVRQSFFGNTVDQVGEARAVQPAFDLDNESNGTTGDASVKVIMARQLYVLALLVAGENVMPTPSSWGTDFPMRTAELTIPGTGVSHAGTTEVENYRKAVAQWAVNMVDFRDPDSIMTVFEYDVNPFNDPRIPANVVDGDPTTDEGAERGIVYGLERPELLMTETIAAHDRQLQDVATEPSGATIAGGDTDWDSARLPNSAAYIELYHPWVQTYGASNRHQALPRELTTDPSVNPDGVHLNKLAPAAGGGAGTPVWRIVVLRGENAATPSEPVRSIFFVDPSDSEAPPIPGDSFYPAGDVPAVSPGEYAVIGSTGNVAGRNMFTFGRLTTMTNSAPTAAEINATRSIELTNSGVIIRDPVALPVRPCKTIIIDRSVETGVTPRGLSLSDPNGGYIIAGGSDVETDGTLLTDGLFPPVEQARDTPYDASIASGPYHDDDDVDAIWTNGVMIQKRSGSGDYQFRVLYLQRLADPNSPFDIDANPYITVDIANVDLLAFNGLVDNPNNGTSAENGPPTLTPFNGFTQMGGIERGEKLEEDATDNMLMGKQVARRSLFRFGDGRATLSADVGSSAGDNHTFSYGFTNSGERLETLGARNAAFDDDSVPFGWLAWNNRPYANHMELANVPMLSAEGLIRHFGESEDVSQAVNGNPIQITTDETSDQAFSYFFGDDQFAHLPGFGQVSRNGTPGANRFDALLDYVEAPNRFMGSETWLSANVTGTTPVAPNALLCNLHAPFSSIPNFRSPGKINLNTIYEEDVWNALTGGFGDMTFDTFRMSRSASSGPTDVGGFFTTAEGADFVELGATRALKGQDKNMFRRPNVGAGKFFVGVNETITEGTTDIESAASFRNEVRTRLGGLTTARSSVYAFWITIGYFEVDEYGRVGSELGADEGGVRRNRAFYMVDRSIPVACEPGKNHNVDQAVLVRTIIE